MPNKEINSHMPDKYCPVCGACWVPHEMLGDIPTCVCARAPVSQDELTIRPLITIEASTYMDCPFPPWDESELLEGETND